MLSDALDVSARDVVVFVGAGGKSSAIRAVAAEQTGKGRTVIALPTTKMTVAQGERLGPIVVSGNPSELASKAKAELSSSNAVVAGSALISKSRIGGLDSGAVLRLRDLADVLLVEADGARGRQIKGTAEHEPAIPGCATLVVAVAGIDALGKPATEEYVHRPELFSVQTGVGPGQSITPRAFARALSDGSLADIPENARPAALITGVEPGQKMADASIVARELWRAGIKRVVLTSLKKEDPPQVWTL